MNVEFISQSVEIITPYKTRRDFVKGIELAARTCYRSEASMGNHTSEFLMRLIDRGHISPIEFGYAHVKVTTSRAIANEIVRHRLFSYCQESTRYCNYVKRGKIEFVVPHWAKGSNNAERMHFQEACEESAQSYYSMLITMHKHPEEARDVLPLATATTINMGGNFRTWRHFLKQRLNPNAHPDIQDLAKAIQNGIIRDDDGIIDPLLEIIFCYKIPYGRVIETAKLGA